MITRARHRLGTTLVEVLVAIAFLGICSAGVIQAVTTSQYRASSAQDRMLALALAENEIEELRMQARTDDDDANDILPIGDTTRSLTGTGIPGTVTLRRIITVVSGYTNLCNVTVRVEWTSTNMPPGRTGSLQIDTLVRAPDV